MIEIQDLTHVIAALDGLMVITLLTGWLYIRSGNREMHKKCMIGTIIIAIVFLIIYGIYKANSGFAKFGGEGPIRTFYFSFLAIHVFAAAFSLFLVPVTAIRALRGKIDLHRKIARWTLPVWLFVGISGVFVYIMAVHLYPMHGT